MLVLSRRQNEQIRIGNDITITILRVKGQTVRVGIEAPRDIHVVRGELERRETIPAVTSFGRQPADVERAAPANERRAEGRGSRSIHELADEEIPATAGA